MSVAADAIMPAEFIKHRAGGRARKDDYGPSYACAHVRCRRARADPRAAARCLSRLPRAPVPGKLGAVGSFEEDVVVEPCGGGRYHGQLDHSWDLVRSPAGQGWSSRWRCAAGLEVGDPDACVPVRRVRWPGRGPALSTYHVQRTAPGPRPPRSRPRSATRGLRQVPVSLRCSARRAGVLDSSSTMPPTCRNRWRAPPTENHRHLGSSRLSPSVLDARIEGVLPLATRHGSNTSPRDPTWPHGCGSTGPVPPARGRCDRRPLGVLAGEPDARIGRSGPPRSPGSAVVRAEHGSDRAPR